MKKILFLALLGCVNGCKSPTAVQSPAVVQSQFVRYNVKSMTVTGQGFIFWSKQRNRPDTTYFFLPESIDSDVHTDCQNLRSGDTTAFCDWAPSSSIYHDAGYILFDQLSHTASGSLRWAAFYTISYPTGDEHINTLAFKDVPYTISGDSLVQVSSQANTSTVVSGSMFVESTRQPGFPRQYVYTFDEHPRIVGFLPDASLTMRLFLRK